MGNYNDYQLEDAEDAAVRKSKNLKRGLAIGGAVVGAGAASAYAATTLSGNDEAVDTELTPDDIIGGAQAAADAANEVAEEANAEAAPAPKAQTHKVEHEDHKSDINVEESTLLYDEDGNYLGAVDEGTINGKSFTIVDTDGNGKGDIIAYDKNGNGIYEDDEISYMDNKTHIMGQGENVAIYRRDEWGDFDKVQSGPNFGNNQAYFASRDNQDIVDYDGKDDIYDIRNDYQDEKTGEVYRDDYAENNSDYYNKAEAEQYTASTDSNEDYGYNEHDDLASYDNGVDESYDYQA